MNLVRYLVLLLAVLVPGQAGMAAPGDPPGAAAAIRVELKDGLLSAEYHDAPLPQVLAEIGKVAGFRLVEVAGFNDFPRIDGAFAKQPPLAAVERLLANTNRILFFSRAEGAQSRRVLSKVWLLGPGEADADIARPTAVVTGLRSEEPLIRRQALLQLVQQQGDEAVLDKLSMLLQTDPDPLLRSRAATALGSMQDERAIPELESALQDDNFSVRAQSMTALARFGGDRVIMTLGNILLDDNIDPLERVIAAQALGKQDSEIARGYLQAGSNDANEEVRAAARMASAAALQPGAGSEAAQ